MFQWVINFFEWAVKLWGGMPASTRKEIIFALVQSCAELFKNYYQSKKAAEG